MQTCCLWFKTHCYTNLVSGLKLKFGDIRIQQWMTPILCLVALVFPASAFTAPDARQSTLFVNNCAQCHANPETGAPFVGVAEQWQEAVSRGEDAMLVNVVQGIRTMPPLGYCSACSEQDFRVLIRMMAGMPDAAGEQP